MKKIEEIFDTILQKSFPNLMDIYSAETDHIIAEIKENLIYICEHDFFYYQDGDLLFQTQCVTGENGFGCTRESAKTPIGLHYISDCIGDGLNKYQKFERRIPVCIEKPVRDFEKKPGVYTRILRLDGVEEKNRNTLSRGVYIHGNIHQWYWKTDNLKRSQGCIGLQMDEMIEFYNLIKDFKKRIFVFIESNK